MTRAGVRLVKYDAACRALAEAERVDEVKQIHDAAKARAAYARVAKNTGMRDAAEAIRRRAQRRLGELMKAQGDTFGKATGAKGIGTSAGYQKTRTEQPPTLAEAGIDKNLAARARKDAAMGEPEFEAMIDKIRDGDLDTGNFNGRAPRRKKYSAPYIAWLAPAATPDLFISRADTAKIFAAYSGDEITREMFEAARAVVEQWADLAVKLEQALVRPEPDTLAANP